ncbi:MAG: dihydropteroate synthase [Solirubrobacterales bacterium]
MTSGTTKVMGIVNVTPDSFSDGGLYLDPEQAVSHGLELLDEGADLVDLGGESTRPGAEPVAPEEELRRVTPVVERLAERATVSIDTSKAVVAEAAIGAGAEMVNDVTALRGDPEMAATCAEAGVEVVLMHMLGEPRTMQEDPAYGDVVEEVLEFLVERARIAEEAGIAREKIWIDPGIGFGKTAEHNFALLAATDRFVETGYRVLVGPSRKRFIGSLDGSGEAERVGGTVAACLVAARKGASAVRVHDVAPVFQALALEREISAADPRGGGTAASSG